MPTRLESVVDYIRRAELRHDGLGKTYRVGVSIEVVGDDPLVDGMRVAVRLRRDFVVADSEHLLEGAGLIGDAADATLATYQPDGLVLGGWHGRVTIDDPWPLTVGPDCVERDVFALPSASRVESE